MKCIRIILLSLGAVAIVLFACVYCGLRGPAAIVQTSGFADEKFLLLLFPAGEDASLGRAVIATISEYKQGSIEVYVNGAAVAVPRSGFTPVPPRDYAAGVERLNKELAVWGDETDWSSIEYSFTPSEGGGKAVVTVRDKGGTTRWYTYLVEGSSIRPVEAGTKANVAKNLAQ